MRRASVVFGAAAALPAAAAGAASLGLGGARGDGAPAGRPTAPAATAPVTRQTLTRTVALRGDLDHGPTVPLAAAATGTVTWLAPTGSTVKRGGTLLRVDERPVLLLYGDLPMYRALAAGAKGEDVRQLEKNLDALGYGGFTVDGAFSAATTAAVKRWQRDLELPETGTVERERVVVAPGAIRVEDHRVRLGAAATGDVLGYTGTAKVVTVRATAGDVGWAAPGTAVTVVLPGGQSVAGKVQRVGADAVAAQGGDPSEASPGTDNATVPVTVTLADQKAVGRYEKTPVDVRYVAESRPDVLTVPVAALLALAEGGYGVEVVSGGGSRTVAVEAGLFAEGRVEVSGAGLTEGALVGVPQ